MTRIKLCGLTRPEDIRVANRLGPDYVGFVFAPSKRRISPAEAARLRALLDPAIQAVGVFVNEDPAAVAGLAGQGVIQLAQLHGDEDAAYMAALRALSPVPVIKAVGVGNHIPEIPAGADYILLDAQAGSRRGGTGKRFDWALAQGWQGLPFFLGGGVGPDNVAEAVARLRPYAVDASSALETDGKKDPEKMRAFVEAVRRLEE